MKAFRRDPPEEPRRSSQTFPGRDYFGLNETLSQLSLFAVFCALKYTVCLYILNIFNLYRFYVINVFIYL